MPTTPLNPSPAVRCDDARLLERLRGGDDDAFDLLVRVHARALLATARRMLGVESDSQDAVQEAFLSAYRGLSAFDGRASVATWLHRIVVNTCLMRLRAARRKPEHSPLSLLPEYLEDGHQRTDTRPWRALPTQTLERVELCRLVRATIDELPMVHREVILLRDIEGLGTDEAAAMLGISAGALKVRLHRARQALRTLLEPHFVEVLS
ncbi:MAG: sigma-70 family RNA polymerase sigma factor [Nannocystaceae bacterium]|nr:sigma-70 family RNA polymerase sigma factor [Nannocystaceae bacterium]